MGEVRGGHLERAWQPALGRKTVIITVMSDGGVSDPAVTHRVLRQESRQESYWLRNIYIQ